MARKYRVAKGETLSHLAKRFYGDARLYPIIAHANRIKNPNLILAGQDLIIPDLPPPEDPKSPQDPTPRPTRRRSPAVNVAGQVDVRLLRAVDLLDAHLTAPDCLIEDPAEGEDAPVLVAAGKRPLLVLHLPPQHVGELTVEEPVDESAQDPVKAVTEPAAHTASGPSRLVFELPPRLRVPFTLESLLALMPTLKLRVPTAAVPATEEDRPKASGGEPSPDGSGTTVSIGERVAALRVSAGHESQGSGGVPRDDGVAASPRAGRRATAGRGEPSVVEARPPDPDRTAIEAPYRLTVSPSELGAFSHRSTPMAAGPDEDRVELWRTHLTVRLTDEAGAFAGHDDTDDHQRIVRAVSSPDLDAVDGGHSSALPLEALAAVERSQIVRLTSGVRRTPEEAPPLDLVRPLQVRSLALSALGAWLDWSGAWQTGGVPLLGKDPWIDGYRHRMVMGRDAYVRVTVPGFLFPFGHRAVWVKVSERKVRRRDDGVAYLWQREFIVVREPTRTYPGVDDAEGRNTPFGRVSVEPLVTPNLDRITREKLQTPFVPERGGLPFEFTLSCVDRAGEVVTLAAPLVFVAAGVNAASAAETYRNAKPGARVPNAIDARGQKIAVAPPSTPGDTVLEIQQLVFTGVVSGDGCTPRLQEATAVVPAMKHLAPRANTVTVSYAQPYLDHAFGADNPGALFLALAGNGAAVDFTTGSERGGGFLSPSLPVRGLSRTLGAVGENGTRMTAGLGLGKFDPKVFLDGALPKLFGLINLIDLLDLGELAEAPTFVTETLDAIASVVTDATRLNEALDHAEGRLRTEANRGAHDGAKRAADDALRKLKEAADVARRSVAALQATVPRAVVALTTGDTADADAFRDAANALASPVANLLDVLHGPAVAPHVPAAVRAVVERPAEALWGLATQPHALENLLGPARSVTARFEWAPKIHSWPPSTDEKKHIFHLIHPSGQNLRLAVEVRAGAQSPASVDVAAELVDFDLRLLPSEPLMRLPFRRIGFRVRSGAKPEIDVVFGRIEFLGVLGFIDTLRQMIPFDGFADPPYVDVAPDGVTAGFDLALPNVAIGVFSLENIALAADARVPFLGDAVTVGFAFCSKEAPFRLTVMMVGGGGWVALRASPKGLVMLEVGLEAAASLSVDLGVASGSVSVAVGVYLRLEDDRGSLTAYFRIRGEVDVLGLVSASITLELSLRYDFSTGKLVGRASLVVEVEVLFFSASVEITVERRLAGSGSASDPTLMDVLPPGAGGDEDWALYCAAFAAPTIV